MAVSSSAINLAQYAQMSNDPLIKKITYSLKMYGNVLVDIPFVTDKSMVQNGSRWVGNLPTVNWSPLNQDPTVVSGTPSPFSEQAYIIRNAIDCDRFIAQDKNRIVDPRSSQVEAYLKAVTYDWNDKFLNNDPNAGDVNAIVGLRYRINNGSTYGVRSENKIDGGGLDLTQATLATTPSNGNKLLEFLDQLLWSVDSQDGASVKIYMNEVLLRRVAFALRGLGTSGGLDITKDQFGRRIMTFRGAELVDIGYKADQSTRIITNLEESTGVADGGSTYTSMYAVNYDMDHFFGWQFDPLSASVQDIGLIGNGGSTYRTVIDWCGGLYNQHTRSMARLFGLKMS